MAIFSILAAIIAFMAYQRAARAERALHEQKAELEKLRAWLTQWYEQSVAAQARAAKAAQTDDAGGAEAAASSAAFTASPTTPTPSTPVPSTTAATTGVSGPIITSPIAPDASPRDAALPGTGQPAISGADAAARYAQADAQMPPIAAAAQAATAASGEPAAQPFSTHPGASSSGAAGARTPAQRAEDADEIESQIGGRWLLYIGIGALVLGVSYFVKYAFDNQWITESMRVGLGLLGGLALVAVGQAFVTRGLALYGQVLTGGGVGVLYLAIYAAQQWYGMISQPVATAGMVITTAFGVWLADRQRSQPLALFAILVGFATPFLVSEGGGSQVALFLYDAVLVCGTIALARRREWPLLNLASYALTLGTIAAWLAAAYDPRQYLLTEGFLTLFLALFLWTWREMRRYSSPAADAARLLLAAAPVLYHLVSVSILFPQRGALLVYLIIFSAAGVTAARQMQRPWIRLASWVGAAIPLLAFLVRGVPSGWLIAAWIALLAIYGLHLVAQLDRVDDEPGPLPWEEVLLLHANGIWLLLAADALLRPRMLEAEARSSVALALLYALFAGVAYGWRRDVALHAAALTATFVAAAAGFYFDGPWFIAALAIDGAALMWLALRTDRRWMYGWGGLILVLAIVRTLVQIGTPTPVSYLPVLNPRGIAGLFVVAMMAGVAWLSGRARTEARLIPGARDVLIVGANLLALVVLSAELFQYFEHRAWSTGAGVARDSTTQRLEAERNANFSRELSLSIFWAVYAVGMVYAGIKRHYRPIRYFAIMVLGFTILKVFTVDIATLDRVSKMLGMMGLGVLLLLASYLYQRVSADANAARRAQLAEERARQAADASWSAPSAASWPEPPAESRSGAASGSTTEPPSVSPSAPAAPTDTSASAAPDAADAPNAPKSPDAD